MEEHWISIVRRCCQKGERMSGNPMNAEPRYYCFGIRIPRWLFVFIYGEPQAKQEKEPNER